VKESSAEQKIHSQARKHQ